MSLKRIVVVCPGRGSYTKDSLGYLNGRPEISNELKQLDAWRSEMNEPTISDLDNSKSFKTSLHTKGEHASPLIYACSLADFLSIDQNQYEIVAVTGNSMGWYLALSFAEALERKSAFQLIQTMGSMMKSGLVGGQIIYPWVDEAWRMDSKAQEEVMELIQEANNKEGLEAYLSIALGGYAVIAGNQRALQYLSEKLPKKEHYPFQLINHGAFHTPMMDEISKKAFSLLSEDLFKKPKLPLVDGRGHIWQPYSTDTREIYEYTLGHQVFETYDFTKAISTSLKEFAPDHIVLLGPGNSLGGSIGQIMIENAWDDISSKEEFSKKQKENPFLISMGLKPQKALLQATL